jgi:hypothetical protein
MAAPTPNINIIATKRALLRFLFIFLFSLKDG